MKFTRSILSAALCIAAVAAGFSPRAQAQLTPTDIAPLSGLPTVVLTTNLTTTNNISLVPGKGLAVQASFKMQSAATSNVVFYIYPSADGTNFSTAPLTTMNGVGNGTTTVILSTNFSAATLAGYVKLNFGSISNQNIAALTNLAAIYSREK